MATFFFQHRPKKFDKPRSMHKWPSGPIWRPVTPDYLNMAKAVEDGLSGVAYEDDRYLVCGQHFQFYHERNGAERTVVFVGEVPPICEPVCGPPWPDEVFEEAISTCRIERL